MIDLDGQSEIMMGDETLTLRRQDNTLGDGVIIVDGKRVFRGYKDYTILANVQPVNGRDLLLQPEGDRFDEQLTFFVPTQDVEVAANDLILRGDFYLITQAETWGSYTRAIGTRVDVGPDRAIGV